MAHELVVASNRLAARYVLRRTTGYQGFAVGSSDGALAVGTAAPDETSHQLATRTARKAPSAMATPCLLIDKVYKRNE